MKKEVSEADGIKLLSDSGPAPVGGNPKLGDKSRSIRKRGFWRANKRGELLAVVFHMKLEIIKNLSKQMYGTKVIVDMHVKHGMIYLMYPPKELK